MKKREGTPQCIPTCLCGNRPEMTTYELGGTILPPWDEFQFHCPNCGIKGERMHSFTSARDSWERKVVPEKMA